LSDLLRVYWDSCVWIGLLNEEPVILDSAKWAIERAEKGEIEIWSSNLVLAEVFKVKTNNGDKALLAAKDAEFDKLYNQPFIQRVQVDADIAREARRLLRAGTAGLKRPNDAIHLASAVWWNLDELYTHDHDDLLRLDGTIKRRDGKNLKICKPPPRVQAQLSFGTKP
jgi:predicted nucleic acid-binding protein